MILAYPTAALALHALGVTVTPVREADQWRVQVSAPLHALKKYDLNQTFSLQFSETEVAGLAEQEVLTTFGIDPFHGYTIRS